MLVELSTFKGPPDRLESPESLSRRVQSQNSRTIIARSAPKKTTLHLTKINIRSGRNHPAALPTRADE